MGYDSFPNDEGYHVSFEGKKITVEQVGGGLLRKHVEICKKEGTSNIYEVKYNGFKFRK